MSRAEKSPVETVHAGYLPPWQVGDLPPPPIGGWRGWLQLLGPGVLLAGASVGTGEWLFGPAVSAQYGSTLLWLATISIVLQVFCNLEFMRYALYCGEPTLVGGMRTHPGPMFWLTIYAILDFSSIWPYNASNAAVPLAAAILGHLPGPSAVTVMGWVMPETQVVKILGYAIFLLAFIPLIFGGAIYRMLERIMAAKLIIVLGFLTFVVVFMVSRSNVRDVLLGFTRFGTIPLRAETIIAGRHFTYSEDDRGPDGKEVVYTVKGTMEHGSPLVLSFTEDDGERVKKHAINREPSADLRQRREQLTQRAADIVARGEGTARGAFYVRSRDAQTTLVIEGKIAEDGAWRPDQFTISDGRNDTSVEQLSEVPEKYRFRCQSLVENKGLEPTNIVGYIGEHGQLPRLDWAMIASFISIAGAGGLTNVMFSNYARDKGWGMGRHVGAIPSAVGGRQIELSHNGKVFLPNDTNMPRWRRWMRHIVKDQLVIWMMASFVGMALPCMLSLEFIRNAPVSGDRVAAMTAEGISARYPEQASMWWLMTLLVGFLVLAPGQMVAGDLLARRWTDIFWSYSQRARRMGGNQVKYVYYGILAAYGAWGLVALTLFDPLQVAKIGGVLQNVALSISALLALYVNRTLLPPEVRPNAIMQIGTVCCGLFFLAVSVIAIVTLL